MKVWRYFLVSMLCVTFLVASYLTLRGSGVLTGPNLSVAQPVPKGDQEIAWLAPATSGSWARLVDAVKHLTDRWPELHPDSPPLRASFKRAFPDLTAGVPEMELWFDAPDSGKLHFRWYKLSSNAGIETWINRLAKRSAPPLAIVGGDNSNRALQQAKVLQDHLNKDAWNGSPPLFLITTATADRYFRGELDSILERVDLTKETHPELMHVYKGRSFRFSFSNARMAKTVIDFIRSHKQKLWKSRPEDFTVLAGLVGKSPLAQIPWSVLGNAQASRYLRPMAFFTYYYLDDRYSKELADRFARVIEEQFYGRKITELARSKDFIEYGTGDFPQANPREALRARWFAKDLQQPIRNNQLLILPTGAQSARRFLRTLTRMAPDAVRNLVVVNGDFSFNNVYLNRDFAWNILDVPIPLLFFSHRCPVSKQAGFEEKDQEEQIISRSGTQDLLLYKDIVSAVLQAAYRKGKLIKDADIFRERLAQTHWYQGRIYNPAFHASPSRGAVLFDEDGNRQERTGEHVVWLRPIIEQGVTRTHAVLTVWSIKDGRWKLVRELQPRYNDPTDQGSFLHHAEE